MSDTLARCPYDPDVEDVIMGIGELLAPLTPEMLEPVRQRAVGYVEDQRESDFERLDFAIPGYEGNEIALTVFKPRSLTSAAPCLYNLHPGGMVMGDRFTGITAPLAWGHEHQAIVTTLEYRLAPEHQDPVPVEDCYAGLVWVRDHAAELDVDPERVVVTGASGGGGLAAGTTLLARDRSGPAILGQLLVCPMLDDRDTTISTRQYEGIGLWDRVSNITGWSSLLGDRYGTDDVTIYAAPARASDLSGLPATYIDVGSAEVFRDEDVACASQIWADGGIAELHVWPGGTHGFDLLAPHAAISRQAVQARTEWLRRLLAA